MSCKLILSALLVFGLTGCTKCSSDAPVIPMEETAQDGDHTGDDSSAPDDTFGQGLPPSEQFDTEPGEEPPPDYPDGGQPNEPMDTYEEDADPETDPAYGN